MSDTKTLTTWRDIADKLLTNSLDHNDFEGQWLQRCELLAGYRKCQDKFKDEDHQRMAELAKLTHDHFCQVSSACLTLTPRGVCDSGDETSANSQSQPNQEPCPSLPPAVMKRRTLPQRVACTEAADADRLAHLLHGTVATMLAAHSLRGEADSFDRYAWDAVVALARARPLAWTTAELEPSLHDQTLAPHQAALLGLRRSTALQSRVVEVGNPTLSDPHPGLDNHPSAWLLLERLLGYLRQHDPPVLRTQPIKVLFFARQGDRGQVVPALVELVPACWPGIYLDLAETGFTLFDDKLPESLRLACEQNQERLSLLMQQQRQTLAVRVRFELPPERPTWKLGGGSAGVLLLCAIRGLLEGRPLNRHATATAKLTTRRPASAIGGHVQATTPSPGYSGEGGMVRGREADAEVVSPLLPDGQEHCFQASSATRAVQPDDVSDASVLAKLEAAEKEHPPLAHVVLAQEQAERFRGHPRTNGLTLHGVRSVDEAYAYLTSEAALDDILRSYCEIVSGQWEELKNPDAQLNQQQALWRDEHRPDKYVHPRYSLLPEGKIPLGDTSRDTRAHEPGRQDEQRGSDGYAEVPGEGDERLIQLLAAAPWLCVTEDAGSGKTVLSLRALSLACSPEGQRRLFEGRPPLVVRLEGPWPEERQGVPVTLMDLLCRQLGPEPRDATRNDQRKTVVEHALRHRRVLLILDAWDQFSEKDREYLSKSVLQPGGELALAECRVLVTSRAYAVQHYQKNVFQPIRWRFGRIEGFNEAEQDKYLHDLTPRWRQMVTAREDVADLLRVPTVLQLLRTIIETTPHDEDLPTFRRRGDLYLEVSLRILQRALEKNEISCTAEQFLQLRQVISTLAFQMMIDERYNYAVAEADLTHLLDAAYERFIAGIPNYDRLSNKRKDKVSDAWDWCVEVLKKIELSHRSILEAWTQETLSFRSRKVMEWYAAFYLANYATAGEPVAKTAGDFLSPGRRITPSPRYSGERAGVRGRTANTEFILRAFLISEDWYWTWRFAIEMPAESHPVRPAKRGQRARDDGVLCRTLSLLFEPSVTGHPPTELMYRAWLLFETDESLRRDGRTVIAAYQKQFLALLQCDAALPAGIPTSGRSVAQVAAELLPEFRVRELLLEGLVTPERWKEIAPPLAWGWFDAANWNAQFDDWEESGWDDATADNVYSPLTQRAFVRCPPSTTAAQKTASFWQGTAEDGEVRQWGGERLRHLVHVQPFWMQATAVTVEQYCGLFDPALYRWHQESFAEIDPAPDCPVIDVSWWDAFCFALWLGAELPTESQWEFACRAGHDGERDLFGIPWKDPTTGELRYDALSSQEANFDGTYPFGGAPKGELRNKTVPVRDCQFFPNAWGLWQMHGNVWEWTRDKDETYRERIERLLRGLHKPLPEDLEDDELLRVLGTLSEADWQEAEKKLWEGEAGAVRVMRGGSRSNDANACRCANSFGRHPDDHPLSSGFRVVVGRGG